MLLLQRRWERSMLGFPGMFDAIPAVVVKSGALDADRYVFSQSNIPGECVTSDPRVVQVDWLMRWLQLS